MKACAIDQYSSAPKGWLQITEFIICFFSHDLWNSDPAEAGNQCANKVWVLDPWPTLETCATTNIDVYLKMKEKTEQANADHCMKAVIFFTDKLLTVFLVFSPLDYTQ